MTLVIEQVDEEMSPKELAETGSFNHGYLQLKIGACFLKLANFTPSSELSLDLAGLNDPTLLDSIESLKPDIAVYKQWSVDFQNDIIKAQQMPVLAIEILSPLQGVKTLVDKFKLYFVLGIQSCWLVYPYANAIAVYHAPDEFKLFAQDDVVDNVVGVRIPLHEIFS